jgi:hypothetical protein
LIISPRELLCRLKKKKERNDFFFSVMSNRWILSSYINIEHEEKEMIDT